MPDLADTNIEYLRQWFKACPALAVDYRFGVNYLAENPTEYALYLSPSTILYHENVLGENVPNDIQTLNYIFASKESYGADIRQNLENAGFYDAVVSWIIDRNAVRDFPEMVDGNITSIVPTLTAYVAEAGSDTAKYQIQLKVTYKRS